jgi:hypothetical protein
MTAKRDPDRMVAMWSTPCPRGCPPAAYNLDNAVELDAVPYAGRSNRAIVEARAAGTRP